MPRGGTASQPLGCLIEPYRVTDVGSQVIGVIESIHVERGEWVRKGDVIAMLRADVERAAVAIALSRVQGEAEVQAAIAAKALADQKLERSRQLVDREFLSKRLVTGRASRVRSKSGPAPRPKRVLEGNDARPPSSSCAGPPPTTLPRGAFLSPASGEDKPIVRVAARALRSSRAVGCASSQPALGTGSRLRPSRKVTARSGNCFGRQARDGRATRFEYGAPGQPPGELPRGIRSTGILACQV